MMNFRICGGVVRERTELSYSFFYFVEHAYYFIVLERGRNSG